MRTTPILYNYLDGLDNSVERLIYTSQVAMDGFWERKNFYLLPEATIYSSPQIIVLPRLNYLAVEDYWTQCASLNREMPISIPKMLADDVRKIIPEKSHTDSRNIRHKWDIKRTGFEMIMDTMFGEEWRRLKQIDIIISEYGSIASYDASWNKTKSKITVALRNDADISHLAEVIISSLMYPQKQNHLYSWEEFEAAVDMIMNSPGMAALFPNYQATIQALRETNPNLRSISKKYIKELGLPINEPPVTTKFGRLYLNGKEAFNFTKREIKFLQYLDKLGGRFASFDETADIMWGEDKEVSLYAINKMVQRLRLKMINHGCNTECITTLRKRGYLLNLE